MVQDRHLDRRLTMVRRQIEGRGVRDPRVLDAMRTVPRHRFVSRTLSGDAYKDHPLPIGSGQTISQPYIVALMAEAAAIEPDNRVLEVGTGSGYGAAVLAELAASGVSVERHRKLANSAAQVLAELGYDNATVVCADGSQGHLARRPLRRSGGYRGSVQHSLSAHRPARRRRAAGHPRGAGLVLPESHPGS